MVNIDLRRTVWLRSGKLDCSGFRIYIVLLVAYFLFLTMENGESTTTAPTASMLSPSRGHMQSLTIVGKISRHAKNELRV